MGITRRDAIKMSGVAAAALAVTGCNSEVSPAKGATASSGSTVGVGTKAPLPDAKGTRVVIVGGGWSGLSIAKYTKKMAPNAEVILVEQRTQFMSCPLSNLWVVGAIDLEFLTHDYLQAARENNYTFFNATVVGVDKKAKTVQTSNGNIDYDHLVLAPGIDYDYSAWTTDIALENRLRQEYPAGFKPGSEHITLKNKVQDFEGGNFILTVPDHNYRCLPAPYERACLIADYFKKEGIKGKVILLDANPGITIKAEGFSSAMKELYGEFLEYHPQSKIENIDLDKKVVTTEFDEFKFEDAAFYPRVRGAKILEVAGVAKDSAFNKQEGNIDPFTYEVIGEKNIYVTGDARPMGFSKSGNTSNSEGHFVAKVLANRINGKGDTKWESPLTVCYSAISTSPIMAISVNAGYAYNEQKKSFGFANASMNENWHGKSGKNNGKLLKEWAKGMFRDMFN